MYVVICEPLTLGLTGHYNDLFVMRKHDSAHYQGDTCGTMIPTWGPGATYSMLHALRRKPATLQHQPDGYYQC